MATLLATLQHVWSVSLDSVIALLIHWLVVAGFAFSLHWQSLLHSLVLALVLALVLVHFLLRGPFILGSFCLVKLRETCPWGSFLGFSLRSPPIHSLPLKHLTHFVSRCAKDGLSCLLRPLSLSLSFCSWTKEISEVDRGWYKLIVKPREKWERDKKGKIILGIVITSRTQCPCLQQDKQRASPGIILLLVLWMCLFLSCLVLSCLLNRLPI